MNTPARLDLPDADVVRHTAAFAPEEADRFLEHLLAATQWRHDRIRVFGRETPMPRLTAWYGDFTYTYTGIVNNPAPWTPALLAIKARAEAVADHRFNGVLMNQYRGGRDSVSWHSDDEHELGSEPVIASVSFGASRRFQFRRKDDHRRRTTTDLHHGDILVKAHIQVGRDRGCSVRTHRTNPNLHRVDVTGLEVVSRLGKRRSLVIEGGRSDRNGGHFNRYRCRGRRCPHRTTG